MPWTRSCTFILVTVFAATTDTEGAEGHRGHATPFKGGEKHPLDVEPPRTKYIEDVNITNVSGEEGENSLSTSRRLLPAGSELKRDRRDDDDDDDDNFSGAPTPNVQNPMEEEEVPPAAASERDVGDANNDHDDDDEADFSSSPTDTTSSNHNPSNGGWLPDNENDDDDDDDDDDVEDSSHAPTEDSSDHSSDWTGGKQPEGSDDDDFSSSPTHLVSDAAPPVSEHTEQDLVEDQDVSGAPTAAMLASSPPTASPSPSPSSTVTASPTSTSPTVTSSTSSPTAPVDTNHPTTAPTEAALVSTSAAPLSPSSLPTASYASAPLGVDNTTVLAMQAAHQQAAGPNSDEISNMAGIVDNRQFDPEQGAPITSIDLSSDNNVVPTAAKRQEHGEEWDFSSTLYGPPSTAESYLAEGAPLEAVDNKDGVPTESPATAPASLPVMHTMQVAGVRNTDNQELSLYSSSHNENEDGRHQQLSEEGEPRDDEDEADLSLSPNYLPSDNNDPSKEDSKHDKENDNVAEDSSRSPTLDSRGGAPCVYAAHLDATR